MAGTLSFILVSIPFPDCISIKTDAIIVRGLTKNHFWYYRFTGAKTFVCVAAAGIPSFRVKQLIETKSYNIATVDWLVRALGGETAKEKLLNFQPQDMICCTEAMEIAFTKRFDVYGDSFSKRTTIDNLKVLLAKIEFKVI